MQSGGMSNIKEPKDNTWKIIIAVIVVIVIVVWFLARSEDEISLGQNATYTTSIVQDSEVTSE